MLKSRVIPVLLLKGRGFVKTTNFKNPVYLGDPINIVKIFNEKEVDEIVILDIAASIEKRLPQFELIKEIVTEAFMPVTYGGGLNEVEDVKKLFRNGIEKVSLNSITYSNPLLIKDIVKFAGSQSVVVSMDVKRNFFGKYELYSMGGKVKTNKDISKHIIDIVNLGAGEILINSIDRDGTMTGYDLDLVKMITKTVDIPVIVCGGAKNKFDLKLAIDNGASAAAAGSMFVFQGKHKAVLISYPSLNEQNILFQK